MNLLGIAQNINAHFSISLRSDLLKSRRKHRIKNHSMTVSLFFSLYPKANVLLDSQCHEYPADALLKWIASRNGHKKTHPQRCQNLGWLRLGMTKITLISVTESK